ncbi:hypothetical protein PENTCL1PPCAC_25838, partial [Pristionchus entomophagus]
SPQMSAHHHIFRILDLSGKSDINNDKEEARSLNIVMNAHNLFMDGQAELTYMMKKVFGLIETTEIRKFRIERAMKAFDNEKLNETPWLAQPIAKVFDLAMGMEN